MLLFRPWETRIQKGRYVIQKIGVHARGTAMMFGWWSDLSFRSGEMSERSGDLFDARC